MTRTSAQRHNDRMARIFEEAKLNNAKNAPLHLAQMLTRLVEKVERANSIQHSGGRVTAEDWSELYCLAIEAKKVLEAANISVETFGKAEGTPQ